jgi:threonine aldolase
VGSVLIGDHAFIAKARRIRKRMGGGMRQAGFLAAACMYALNNHINRLADDHTKASQIAGVLKQLQWVEEIMPVETNIVLFKTLNAETANDILLKLKARDIWAAATGNGWIRFVTHLDITDAMVQNLEIQLKAI